MPNIIRSRHVGGRKQPVNNIVVVSDTHCGCRLGLCTERVLLDDGGTYEPSALQKKITWYWKEFWGEWVPRATKGEPYVVVHNGDAIDGSHHGAVTQVSQNIGDQVNIAANALRPVVEDCEGRYYHIRGTEAHVGPSAQYEERLAQMLNAIPNEGGQHSRYDLWIAVGGGRVRGKLRDGLVHFMHHIGTTGSAAHEASAINAEIAAEYGEAGRWNMRPPDSVVRSHRHMCCEVRLPSAIGYASSFSTAAWQLKTPFSWKVASRTRQPQIGGSLIRMGDEELHARHCVWGVERSATVVQ